MHSFPLIHILFILGAANNLSCQPIDPSRPHPWGLVTSTPKKNDLLQYWSIDINTGTNAATLLPLSLQVAWVQWLVWELELFCNQSVQQCEEYPRMRDECYYVDIQSGCLD